MKRSIFTVLLAALAVPVLQAQILTWNSVGTTVTQTTLASTSNAGVAAADLTFGPGLNAVGTGSAGNRFGGFGWNDTLEVSIAADNYITFTLIPLQDTIVELTTFAFIWDRSSSGPNAVALRSSIDNFATNVGDPVTGIAAAKPNASINPNTPSNFSEIVFNLSGITSPVTFRIYGYGGTAPGSSGVGGFRTVNNATLPNIRLNGSFNVIPEPNVFVLLIAALIVFAGAHVRRRRQLGCSQRKISGVVNSTLLK